MLWCVKTWGNSQSKHRVEKRRFKPFRADMVEKAIHCAIVTRIESRNHPSEQTPEQLRSDVLEMAASLPPEQLTHGLQVMLNRLNCGRSPVNEDRADRILFHLQSWDGFSQQKKARVAALLLTNIELAERQVTLYWRL